MGDPWRLEAEAEEGRRRAFCRVALPEVENKRGVSVFYEDLDAAYLAGSAEEGDDRHSTFSL